MKVLRLTDQVEIKFGDIVVTISPISREQKADISSCVKMHAGKEIVDYEGIAIKTIQYSVKNVTGLTDYNGENYNLFFEPGVKTLPILTEECAMELLGVFASTPITQALSQVVSQNLSEIEGIEFKVVSRKK